MANTSPEFLLVLDSNSSNTYSDQGFKKFFKSNQIFMQEAEVRIQKWVEAFYLELSTFNDPNSKYSNQKISSNFLLNSDNQEDKDNCSTGEESLAQILTPTFPSASIPSKSASFHGSAQIPHVQSAFSPKAEPISELMEDGSPSASDNKNDSPNVQKMNIDSISSHSLGSQSSKLQIGTPNAAAPTLQRPPYFPPYIETKFLDGKGDRTTSTEEMERKI